MPEAFCQSCSGQADASRKIRYGPRIRGLLMKESKRLPDDGIASPGKPADFMRRQCADVSPQRFNEEHFGKFREHQSAARVRSADFTDRETDRVVQPLA